MKEITSFLNALYAPQAWFLSLSPWVSMSIVGVCVATAIGLAGFILARAGYKPLWALLLLVPTVNVLALWVLAFRKFPRESRQ